VLRRFEGDGVVDETSESDASQTRERGLGWLQGACFTTRDYEQAMARLAHSLSTHWANDIGVDSV
jgi:hypothetical protein